MDDFYTSMKETGVIESQKDSSSNAVCVADALAPINWSKWPAFTAGSAAASDMPDLPGKLGTPFANVQVAQEYLATAQSDVQYRSRLWQVAEDTATINVMSELGGDVGSFAAGAMSNKAANEYMNEMVETELTKNLNEELNMEIFRATAKEDQRNPDTVRGAGTIRQNVPEYMRGDICDRPKRNERPPEWDDTNGLDEEGLGSGPLKPNGSPDAGSSSDSMGPSGGLGSEQNISPDGIISDKDYETGGFFAKCFGWLGFGAGADQCFDQAPMSPYEAEILREEAENSFLGMGGGPGMCLDVDHPAYNPPMFSAETILPPGT